MRAFYLSILVIFVFSSCNEEIETQAQLTAKKLKTDISSQGTAILSISVYNIYDGSTIFSGSNYVITSEGFIVITTNANSSATFNLGELKSYVLSRTSLSLYY